MIAKCNVVMFTNNIVRFNETHIHIQPKSGAKEDFESKATNENERPSQGLYSIGTFSVLKILVHP